MKKNVLVLYGAESVEHDISVITALQAMQHFDRGKYNMIPVYIGRDGKWYIAENLLDKKIYTNFDERAKKIKTASLEVGTANLIIKKRNKFKESVKIDFALLCTHGRIGEDGSLQGMLECAHIPYSSSNVRSCALAMDKIFMKDVMVSREIPNVKYLAVNYEEYKREEKKYLLQVASKLKFPVIIKPSNLGSSIGIKICKDKESFGKAMEYCAQFDKRILVERFVEDFEEYNCAAMQMNGAVKISNIQKVENKEEIFTFEDKYLKESKNAKTKIEASLSKKIKDLTAKVYQIFDCKGVVRVDFIFDKKDRTLYVNELNSIPGSLAFYLFKDLSFKDVLNCLIEEGLSGKEKENFVTAYDSKALEVFENLNFAKK